MLQVPTNSIFELYDKTIEIVILRLTIKFRPNFNYKCLIKSFVFIDIFRCFNFSMNYL